LIRPSNTALFLTYLQIGLTAFGGVNGWARHVLAEKRGWLTEQDTRRRRASGRFCRGRM